MSKPVCLVTAPVATRSGYGAHSRDIIRALIKLDRYDVKVWNVRWGNCPMNALNEKDPNDKMIIDRILQTPQLSRQPDLHIHIVIPNEFHTLGKYNIGITAGLEMTICPPTWLEGMNRMDLNIVPSNFVRDTMIGLNFDVTDKKFSKICSFRDCNFNCKCEDINDKDINSTNSGIWIGVGAAIGVAVFVIARDPVWIGVGVAIGAALDWTYRK